MSPARAAARVVVEVQQIAVAQIAPSGTNPRKSLDQAQLAELAQSIKTVGIQVPLTVRLLGSAGDQIYELVGGERRWRAAQLAGLETVPAIVRTMTDAECREAQLVENLQREDLSPMEEAEAYEQLISRASEEGLELTDDRLAAKTGKPLGHVRSRRKLLELIPEARAALAEQLITFGCALLIAKLLPADQERATTRALNYHAKDLSGALEGARKTKADAAQNRADAEAAGEGDLAYFDYDLVSEMELKSWIADNILLDLGKAPWPLDSDTLHTGAGACIDCPKRSGADQALFAELTAKTDICTDPVCYTEKRQAFVRITTAAAKESGAPLLKLLSSTSYEQPAANAKSYKRGQWLEAKPASCPDVRQGMTDEGQVLWVCVGPKCKTHKHQLHVAPAKGSTSSGGKQESWEEREKREKAIRDAYVAQETPVRQAVCAEVQKKLRGSALQRLIFEATFPAQIGDRVAVLVGCERKALNAKLEAAKPAEFEPLLAAMILAPYMEPWRHGAGDKNHRGKLWALAKAAGVNADKVAARVEAEQSSKAAKSSPAAKAAASPSAAAQKKAKKPAANGGKR